MKLFKDKTIGNKNNCVIMGKNTFMSIPEKYRPLSQRHNVILTRDYSLQETYENDTVRVEFVTEENVQLLIQKYSIV